MNVRHRILICIVLSYLVDLLFTLFEFEACTVKPWHIFYYGEDLNCGYWNGWVSDSSFAYGFFAMGSRALIFLSAWMAIRNKVMLSIFSVCLWVEVADAIDYFFVRNGWWQIIPEFDFWLFHDIKFEFNFIKVPFITAYAAYEWKK